MPLIKFLNKIIQGDCLDLMQDLPDNCVDMVLTDPPYYKIHGEFDYAYKNFNQYLADVEKWALEIRRILKDNGSILWFGDEKNIAYSQVIFDKYFKLLNSLVWLKRDQKKGAQRHGIQQLDKKLPDMQRASVILLE